MFFCLRKIIPDENCCWNPETLMTEILSEVHYLPDSWRGQAHTTLVRDQFSQLFQYKAVSLKYDYYYDHQNLAYFNLYIVTLLKLLLILINNRRKKD